MKRLARFVVTGVALGAALGLGAAPAVSASAAPHIVVKQPLDTGWGN